MSKKLKDEAATEQWFLGTGEMTAVVLTGTREPLLLYWSTGDDLCYQGMPTAESEDGKKVDPNRGTVESLGSFAWPLAPVWPVAS